MTNHPQLENTAEYHRRICRAIDFIHRHIKEEMTIDAIAAAAPFSKFHFQRVFRAVTGESVAEFIRRLRLESAARKLRLPHLPLDVTRLAYEYGFSSSQNFAKAFKAYFGMSATEYHRATSEEDDAVDSRAMRPAQDGVLHELSVRIVQLPSQRVAYRRHFGSYSDRGVENSFEIIDRWAACQAIPRPTSLIGIPWDDLEVTDDTRCRFDCCVAIPDDLPVRDVNTQTIPPGHYAVMQRWIVDHEFEKPWDELMRDWLPTSGLFPDDRPRFERYLSDGSTDPEGKWLVEINLPVVPS